MASYRVDYLGDCGRMFRAASITIQRFNEAVGVEATTPEYDDRFIPPRLRLALQPDRPICSLPLTPRLALAWIATDQYVMVPIPWPGDRPEFVEALQQIQAIAGVGLVTFMGERLSAGYTGLLY